MNLIELLIFLLVCAALGFLGHFFSARWGWLVGAVPALAVAVIMLVSGWLSLVRELPHSLHSRPACQTGKCTRRHYVLVNATKEKAIFRCRCGDKYVSEGNLFSSVLPDGSVRPYMVRDSSKIWKRVESL